VYRILGSEFIWEWRGISCDLIIRIYRKEYHKAKMELGTSHFFVLFTRVTDVRCFKHWTSGS
jgi:hypothetical protein